MAMDLERGDTVRLAWDAGDPNRPSGTVMSVFTRGASQTEWVRVRFDGHAEDVTFMSRELEVRNKITGEYQSVSGSSWW